MRVNLTGRVASVLPALGLVVVGLVAVTTAMTVLGGNEEPSAAAAPTVAVTPIRVVRPTPTLSTPDTYLTVPLPSTSAKVTMQITRARDPHGAWYVDWRYPQLVAGTTPLVYLINPDIVAEIETRIEVFENGPAAVPDPSGRVNTLIGTYAVDMLSSEVASFTLGWVDNTSSKARPTPTIETLTYALNSARRIDFGEIFIDQPGALNILSAESRTQLSKSLGDGYDSSTLQAGTAALAVNFVNWSMTPAGLKVTFAMYQVAGYEAGTPSVVIPWSRLANVVRADGPAGRLAGLTAPTPTPAPSAVPAPSVVPAPS